MTRWVIAALLLSASALAQKHIQFSWAQGPNPGWTECTSGNFCLDGYTLYETTSGTPVALATVAQSNPSYALSPLPPVGTHIYSVAQNGINGGAPVQSTVNPGLIVNCWKTGAWRNCKITKSW